MPNIAKMRKPVPPKRHHYHIFLIVILLAFAGVAIFLGLRSSKVELILIGNKFFDFSETGRYEDYLEPGYYARHCVLNRCHDLTDEVEVKVPDIESIKAHAIGEYEIDYSLTYLGQEYTDSRKIAINDILPPELNLNGPEVIGMYVGEAFTDPGFEAIDNHDGDLTSSVKVEGGVDSNNFGVYTLKYSVEDAVGNYAEKTRRVFVYDWAAFSSEPIATFDELRDYIRNNGWDISFGFKNFEKDIEYTYRADDLYYGASLVKTIDAMYVYENLYPDYNLKSLVRNAITYSNNGAHNSLVAQLGIENLRTYAENIGMKHHLKGSSIYGDTHNFCDTSVSDQIAEWTHLWYLINNLENGEELKWYFINNYWDNLSFPSSPLHMYKNGLYGNNYHESGIMFANSPFFMTFLSTEGWRWNMTYIMRDLAERTYLINESL